MMHTNENVLSKQACFIEQELTETGRTVYSAGCRTQKVGLGEVAHKDKRSDDYFNHFDKITTSYHLGYNVIATAKSDYYKVFVS